MSGAFKMLADHRVQVKERERLGQVQRDLDSLPVESKAQETSPRILSDRQMLMQGLAAHEVEVGNKPELRGVRVPRSLPRGLSERIDTMRGQLGDDLRKARADGRIRFDWSGGKGRWVVDGITAPEQEAKSEGGRFTPLMFANSATARRQREQRL